MKGTLDANADLYLFTAIVEPYMPHAILKIANFKGSENHDRHKNIRTLS